MQHNQRTFRAKALFPALILCILLPSVGAAASFTVDNSTDAVDAIPGDGICATVAMACSLRAAIQEGNALGGSHTIALPIGFFPLSLTGAMENGAALGDLDINASFTINGAGIGLTRIDGQSEDRIFDVSGNHALSVSDLTLQNGDAQGGDGGAIKHPFSAQLTIDTIELKGNVANNGGAIYHSGGLLITDSIFRNNVADNQGGGIHHDTGGSISISGSDFVGNRSADAGGGLQSDNASSIELSGCQFTRNTSVATGGGANFDSASGALTVSGSTFTSNISDNSGGGINYLGTGGFSCSSCEFTGNVTQNSGGGVRVDGSSDVSISQSRFSMNVATLSGGGLGNFSSGNTTVSNSIFESNIAEQAGAGMAGFNVSSASISDSSFSDNFAEGSGACFALFSATGTQTISKVTCVDNVSLNSGGGGYLSAAGGPASISDSTFAENVSVRGSGGGFFQSGTGTLGIASTTISGNSAPGNSDNGGGFASFSSDATTITNSTISGNYTGGSGGGIYVEADLNVESTTVASNAASLSGSSIYATGGATVTVSKSILTLPQAAENCGGMTFVSGGFNIDFDGSCNFTESGDMFVDPQLESLEDNGGLTATHALMPTSPAIDAIAEASCPSPEVDQRGVARPFDGDQNGTALCDIGSYEFNDACPSDEAKTAPGICGCSTPDIDSNSNTITDCLAETDIKAQAEALKSLVGMLKPKKSKAQKEKKQAVSTTLNALVAFGEEWKDEVSLSDGSEFSALLNQVKKKVNSSRKKKATSPRFKQCKKKAVQVLNKLIRLLE